MLKPSERFNKLSKLYKKQLIPAEQYKKEIPYVYEEAMERNLILQKVSQYYDIDRKIETVYGRFSNVLNYYSKDGQALSLRVIKKKDEGLYESEWQNMKHKNIVTIMNRQSFDEEDAICYLSPYQQYNLKQVITSEMFKTSNQSSMFLPKWIKDITSGLEYIHTKNFAHTNITSNNIIIQDTLVAAITDFHFLNTSLKASNRIGVKYSHRPPESFRNGDGNSSVDCRKVDVWNLGMLAINIFTGLYLEKKLSDNVTCWSQDVYSQIFKVLKKRKFTTLHRTYLKYPSGSDILKSARNFAAFCLQFDPMKRPPVKDLLEHNLMNKSGFLPKKDSIWHKKVPWKKIEKELTLIKDFIGSNEDIDFAMETEPSADLENVNNSGDMENTISLENKSKLQSENQNNNNQKTSDVKQEVISRVIDKLEIPSNCLSGDAEENMIILEDDIAHEEEIIKETLQEDNNTDIKSESDRLADLLLSITEFQMPNQTVENTEIVKSAESIRTSTEIEDKRDTDYFSIASETENYSEDDHLADLLISFSEFRVPPTNDEQENIVIVDEIVKNQNQNITGVKSATEIQNEIKTNIQIQDTMKDNITEEIKIYSPPMQQFKPEKEIKKNIDVIDFQKEKNPEKGRSYWKHEVGVYLLNLFIDNNSSNGILHPENYLFKLVQKL